MDWQSFVGQTEVVSEIQDLIKLHQIGEDFPPICFLGPKGTGKSTIARLTATELSVNFHEFNMGTIDKKAWNRFWRRYNGELVFIDELQFADKRYQQFLMSIITDGLYDLPVKIMFASMGRRTIIPALLDRLTTFELSHYSTDELTQITNNKLSHYNVKLSDDDIVLLAYASQGNLRELERLVWQTWKDQTLFKTPTANSALASRGLTPQGFTKTQMRLLSILDSDLTYPAPVLASMLSVTVPELSDIETSLRTNELIEVTSKGREITRKGLLLLTEN